METKQIISWLYARMLNMAAKRLRELDQAQNVTQDVTQNVTQNKKWLIDAERHKRILERFEEHMIELGKMEAAEAVKSIINGLKLEPTVDAVEVVHGRWEWRHTNEYTQVLTCSVCSRTEGADVHHNYCPNCGADMRERKTDD